MSTRNPANERYQESEDKQGATRKSAAAAKPTSKAASSVYVEGASEPSPNRKRKQKANTPKPGEYEHYWLRSEEYAKWHKIWIGVNVAGVALTIIAMLSVMVLANLQFSMIVMILGIVFLFAGIFLDKRKVTYLRNIYSIDPDINPYDRSKEATARRKAEITRIEQALAEEAAMLEAKRASKAS